MPRDPALIVLRTVVHGLMPVASPAEHAALGYAEEAGEAEARTGMQELQGDRMARLFKHILQQRHMYPVFPPAQGSCVDWHHSKHLDMHRIPNILVLPSPLPPCAKVVELPASDAAAGKSTSLDTSV